MLNTYVVVFKDSEGEVCSGSVSSALEPAPGDHRGDITCEDENGNSFVSCGEIIECYDI